MTINSKASSQVNTRSQNLAQETSVAHKGNALSLPFMVNSTVSVDRCADATGFRTPSLRHRSLSVSHDQRVAETFLLNTRLCRHDYESEAGVQLYYTDTVTYMLANNGIETFDTTITVPLPSPARLRLSLGDCLLRRRSKRLFTGDPVRLEGLSSLLFAAAGITGIGKAPVEHGEHMVDLFFRTTPSPGGLYGVDLYVVALNISGLERGIYGYDPLRSRLSLLQGPDSVQAVLNTFAYPEEVISLSRACALLIAIGRPWKVMRKYGSRGLRYLFIEVGQLAENVHLACTALGYGDVDIAGFYDDDLNEALGLDGLANTVLHTIAVGIPAE
ncbi:SagB/ThcOx family dehydrogenase [Thermogemmatispora sp.]|uniref:SagB/ThcOx family dehydrogenase n=1 Tax=Thermogemmatispora sp. TaxID=1968838 RepID=UPI001DF89A64|nr:SagB/ThcOx family dehydrogenase [Thermogemmatispora sp.]MBX5449855.1 SagB/ThcOx family dehydrogenase [Thermogemmatispora sp.]